MKSFRNQDKVSFFLVIGRCDFRSSFRWYLMVPRQEVVKEVVSADEVKKLTRREVFALYREDEVPLSES